MSVICDIPDFNLIQSIKMIYIPFLVWTMLILLFIILLLRKYTFGNWDKQNPNPYEKETLGLPRGLFRGILTLTLLFVVVLLEVFTLKYPAFETRIEQFMVAFQMMIAFYFGGKVMHHLTSTDKQKSLKHAEILKNIDLKWQHSKPKITKNENEFEDAEAVG